MNTAIKKSDYIWITILSAAAILGSAFFGSAKPEMMLIIPAAFIAAVAFLSFPMLGFITSIIILPVMSSKIMSFQVLPVPGAKINNMLLLLILIGFLINKRMKFGDMKLAAFFYFTSITLLVVAVSKADYVSSFSFEFWKESYSPAKFFLSHGLIPMLTTIPVLFIIGTVRSREQIEDICRYLAFSMMFFASVILFIYLTQVPFGSDFSTVREIIGIDNLGMHGNNIADFFIVGFPLIFSLAIVKQGRDKKWFAAASILSILAIMPIYSRTAYAMILVSVFVIIFLTRSFRFLIPVIAGLILIVFLVPSVTDRALSGIESKTANTITAGRTDLIWGQIIGDHKEEAGSDPEKIIFGHGRYGVVSLPVFRNERMLRVTHSHNMFLDTLVDTGITGLVFYVFIFIYILIKLIKGFIKAAGSGRHQHAHLMAGLFTGLFCFLGRGLTDSFFIPQLTNSYAYIILAISFVAVRKEYDKELYQGEGL